jgi:hypothetical protein
VRETFPHGQLYVNLRGYDLHRPVPAAEALAGFLRALGVAGQDVPLEEAERAARYRSLVASKRAKASPSVPFGATQEQSGVFCAGRGLVESGRVGCCSYWAAFQPVAPSLTSPCVSTLMIVTYARKPLVSLTQKASPTLAVSSLGLGSDAIALRQADGLAASRVLGVGLVADAPLFSWTSKLQFVQSTLER